MTATVLPMRKPTPDTRPVLLPGQRHVEGCGGQLEVHGTKATAAGLCVSCGHITTHRHESGLPACEGADLPERVLERAETSKALKWHVALLAGVAR